MIALFQCRPTGIYKQDYLQELCQRYGDPENVLQAPELPDWCLEEDEASDNETDSGYSTNDRRRKRRRLNVSFLNAVYYLQLAAYCVKLAIGSYPCYNETLKSQQYGK